MKLGISMWSYVAAWKTGDFDIVAFIHECKRLGVDGVELLDFFWKDRAAELPAVEEALRETGLAVGVYSVSNEFVNPDYEARMEQVEIIKRGVDSAVHFGAKTVRVFAGNQKDGVDFDLALAWIIEGLSAAAEYAYANGVTLALENHGKLAGRSDQVETILKAVASPAMKANPDTGNFLLVHEAPHDAVDKLATRAAMVHLKDFHLVPNNYDGFAYTALDGLKFVGKPLGEGDVDLADCILSLKQAGFDGWVNIEYDAEIDPLEGVARSVQFANGLMGR
ncbi:MAG: sugar phosphate isomerase/epimerase [Capsulimonas sp.]|uniref:sugar phosphate isomerase/epimerase family protein n=1 Tax=Capsulimonas sp. TaxID=2494211 RepID=UPI0032656906